jgi:hypothetical protein
MMLHQELEVIKRILIETENEAEKTRYMQIEVKKHLFLEEYWYTNYNNGTFFQICVLFILIADL